MKRFLAFSLTFFAAMLFTVMFFSTTVSAATSGYYTYTVTDGEATITDVHTSISGDVIIPSTLGGYPVTSIGYRAFSDCTGLTSVTIGDSVTSIGGGAFYYCTGLTSIEIPDSVTSIGKGAFSYCNSLTSITVDENNPTYHVSGNCLIETQTKTLIKEFNDSVIPNDGSVTSIGDDAFSGCTGLTSIDIPDSVTSIGNYAFSYCTGLTSVVIPDSVTSIGNQAFDGCINLKSISIPDSVTSIGNYAFSGCTGLTSVTIGDSVTSIGDYAFYYCTGLTSIEIPDSVTSIGKGAFSGCANLESITIPFVGGSRKTASDTYQYPFGYIFGTYSHTGGVSTWQYYYGSTTSSTTSSTYYIPEKLKSVTVTGGDILYGAFYNCSNLTSVTIGDSVTSIGDRAFYRCTGLTSIEIPDSVTSIGDRAFYRCTGLTSIEIPDSVTSIGEGAFYSCTGLTSVVIPDSVTSIGEGAFYSCTGLTSVVIPDSVTSIGNQAFDGCINLKSISIPDSVTSIGDYAFDGCTSLLKVTIPESVESISFGAFMNCTNLLSITLPESVTEIGEMAFSGTAYYKNASNWENGVLYIGNYLIDAKDSFDSDGGLTGEYEVKPGTKYIADGAFIDCENLLSVTIPDGVLSIGDSVFSCSGIVSITIPDSVTSIGSYVVDEATPYYQNYGNWEDGALYIGNHLIATDYELSGNYEVKPGTKTIADEAFLYCGVSSVSIPDSVIFIGEPAFEYCENLESITVDENNPVYHSIGNGVEEHSFDNDCDAICDKCGHTRTITHDFEGVVDEEENCGVDGKKHEECTVCHITRNENTVIPATGNHAYDNACDAICNVCEQEREIPDHVYDNACDTTCNVCEHVREITHDYSDAWINNEEEHWHECTVCGDKTDVAEHDVESGVCTDCGKRFFTVGDVDGEEGITANDAIHLLYNVFFGDEAYPVDQPCDFDGDGGVTANDAIYLLYYVFFGDKTYPLN